MSPPAPSPRHARRGRRLAPGLLAVALAGAVPLAGGASLFEFDLWMRWIDQDSVSVQKQLASGDSEAARKSAQRLEDSYARMERFFAADPRSADAVDISRDGREQASAVLTALQTGDFGSASASALRIARACNDCHDNYKPFR